MDQIRWDEKSFLQMKCLQHEDENGPFGISQGGFGTPKNMMMWERWVPPNGLPMPFMHFRMFYGAFTDA